METTINQRVGDLIRELRLSNNSFAKSIDKASSTVNYIVDGKTKPGFEVLEAITTVYPQVNPGWLMTGEGEMFRKSESVATEPGDGYLKKYLAELEKRVEEQSLTIRALVQQLGKDEVVLAYAASCIHFFVYFGYNFGYNQLISVIN